MSHATSCHRCRLMSHSFWFGAVTRGFVMTELTDELIDELLAESMERNGCERQDRRRFCCDYHEGFEDALDEAQFRLTNR